MSKSIPVHSRPGGAIALALVTVLALLVAPICASLCAARSCSPGASREKCHDVASMGAGGGEQFVAPRKACGAPDSSAVLVKSDEQTSFSRRVSSTQAPMLVSGSTENRLTQLAARPGWRDTSRVSSNSAGSAWRTAILRI